MSNYDDFCKVTVSIDMNPVSWLVASVDGIFTVVQRRHDGSVDFNQSWQRYEDGFGDLGGELWDRFCPRIFSQFNQFLRRMKNQQKSIRIDSFGWLFWIGDSFQDEWIFILNDRGRQISPRWDMNKTNYSFKSINDEFFFL